MRYPRQQADTVALATSMINGITEHSDIFVHCDAAALEAAREQFMLAREALVDAQAHVTMAAATKLEKYNQLQDEMKRQIKLGVVDTSNNPVQLGYIGWGPKREPQDIKPPGQPRNLRIIAQGNGMVFLV